MITLSRNMKIDFREMLGKTNLPTCIQPVNNVLL